MLFLYFIVKYLKIKNVWIFVHIDIQIVLTAKYNKNLTNHQYNNFSAVEHRFMGNVNDSQLDVFPRSHRIFLFNIDFF